MLTRWSNPLGSLFHLQREMDQLFDDYLGNGGRGYSAAFPSVNVWEDAEQAHLEAELPGLSLSQVEVAVAGNEITLSGERKINAPEGVQWHRRERPTGRFTRTLSLPWEVEPDKVEATLRDGVLRVRLPKAASARPRKIKVQSE